MVIDPVNPDRIFLGTSQGEVYVSTDGARSWKNPRGANPFPNYVVDNLVIDGEGRLWAACWGLWGGSVVAVSSDGGATWERRDEGLREASIRALALDPRESAHLVAGGLDGVYRSTDGGKQWQKISDRINVESLAIDPSRSERIFVGTWRQAWRSDDAGKTWKHVNEGMVLDTDVFTISIDPGKPDNVWLATCGWVYNSTNGGDKWTRFRDGFENRRVHDVKVDPSERSRIYAGTVAGLYRSTDTGKNFQLISPDSLVINSIALTAARPQRILLATEGDGVYVSDDAGKTYRRSSTGLYNVRVTAVVPDPIERDRLYAAVVFGNAASGVYVSEDGGEAWARLSTTRIPEVLSLLVQEDTDPRFIAGTEKGFYWSDDGREWTLAEPILLPVRVNKIVRYNKTRRFAATAEGVFTSNDAGRTWYRLGDAELRVVDIGVGLFEKNPALYALTAQGLQVYDGNGWITVTGAPETGRAITTEGLRGDVVLVTSAKGTVAGVVRDRRWTALDEAPYMTEVDHAIVAATDKSAPLFSSVMDWQLLSLPVEDRAVASVVSDPFHPTRLFLGTNGQGVFIYTGSERLMKAVPQRVQTRTVERQAPPAGETKPDTSLKVLGGRLK